MHISKKKHKISLARRMLLLQFCIVTVFFLLFLFQYFRARATDPLYANSYYPALAEYIIGSFVISLGSALLVEAMEQTERR